MGKDCQQVENIKRRLKRIEGQLKGIQRMIDKEACCFDVLVQVSAVRAAMAKVGLLIMENHTRKCLHQALEQKEQDKAINDLMAIMSNFLK